MRGGEPAPGGSLGPDRGAAGIAPSEPDREASADAARPLRNLALLGLLAAGLVSLVPVLAPRIPLEWSLAHRELAFYAFLLPALAAFHVHLVHRILGRRADAGQVRTLTAVYAAAAAGLFLGHLLQPSNVFALVALAAGLLLVAGGVLQTRLLLGVLPRQPVVDVDRDPLTKGDDACVKHLRFAHFFLPVGLLMLLARLVPPLNTWPSGQAVHIAGVHLLMIGYGLLSVYGLSHLVVPRLSGVPAIAAGAIKGELHSSLLGIVGVVVGFLALPYSLGWGRGLLLGLGPFVFLGFFTFMGALGANIMRNKSKTQRVTREFVYVPWTFAGVFWLISAVLMGLFLNVVPDTLQQHFGSLRFLHVHAGLLAGVAQLLLGFHTRLLAEQTEQAPPTFQRTKGPFYLLNAAFMALVLGHLAGGATHPAAAAGAVGTVVSLLWYVVALRPYAPGRASRR